MFAICLLVLILSHQSKALAFDDTDKMSAEKADIETEKAEALARTQEKEVKRWKREGDEAELDKMISEEGGKSDEGSDKPASGEGSQKPSSGEESQKPSAGEGAQKPSAGESNENKGGDDAELEKLIAEEGGKSDEGSQKPSSGESNENKGGDDAELEKLISEEGGKSDEGSQKPSSGEESQKPAGGGSNENKGGDDAELEKMISEEGGKSDEGSQKPSSGEESPKPASGEESQKPSAGGGSETKGGDDAELEKMISEEGGKSDEGSQKPSAGEGSQKPSSGEESQKPSAGGSNENKGGDDAELEKMISEEGGKSDEGSQKPSSGESGQNADQSEDDMDKALAEEADKSEGGGGGGEGGGGGDQNKGGESPKANEGSETKNSGGDESELDKMLSEEGAKKDEPGLQAEDTKSNEDAQNEEGSVGVKKTLAEYIHELELNNQLAETDKAAQRKARADDPDTQSDEEVAVIAQPEEATENVDAVKTASSPDDAPSAAVTTTGPKAEAFSDSRLLKFAILYSLVVEFILATILVVTYRKKLGHWCRKNEAGTETEPLYRRDHQFHDGGLAKPWKTGIKDTNGLESVAFGVTRK